MCNTCISILFMAASVANAVAPVAEQQCGVDGCPVENGLMDHQSLLQVNKQAAIATRTKADQNLEEDGNEIEDGEEKAVPAALMKQFYAKIMKQFDKDGDGKLSWQEVESGAQEKEVEKQDIDDFSKFFKETDSNADGGLEEAELAAFVEKINLRATPRTNTTANMVATSGASADQPTYVASATAASGGICGVVSGVYLPSFCSCTNGDNNAATLDCNVKFLGITGVGLKVTLEPCAMPAQLTIVMTAIGINFKKGPYTSGTDQHIKTPLVIPFGVANIGVYIDVKMQGNVDALYMMLGLNGCAKIGVKPFAYTACGSDIPGVNGLPYIILQGTYDFGSTCSGR